MKKSTDNKKKEIKILKEVMRTPFKEIKSEKKEEKEESLEEQLNEFEDGFVPDTNTGFRAPRLESSNERQSVERVNETTNNTSTSRNDRVYESSQKYSSNYATSYETSRPRQETQRLRTTSLLDNRNVIQQQNVNIKDFAERSTRNYPGMQREFSEDEIIKYENKGRLEEGERRIRRRREL